MAKQNRICWIQCGAHVLPMDWQYDKDDKLIPESVMGAGPVVKAVRWNDKEGWYEAQLSYDNWAIFTGVAFDELIPDPDNHWFGEDELQNWDWQQHITEVG